MTQFDSSSNRPQHPFGLPGKRCLGEIVAAAFGLAALAAPELADSFPIGSQAYRWYTDSIVFNLPDASWGASTSPRYQAAARAIESWNYLSVPGTNLALTRESVNASPYDSTDLHNTLAFVPGGLDYGIAAVTRLRGTGAAPLVWLEADTRIQTDSPPPTWDISLRWANSAAEAESLPDTQGNYHRLNLEGIVRHELGHALGLAGSTEGANHEYYELSLMNANYSFGGSDDPWMHGDDRNGLRYFYPAESQPPSGYWEKDLQVVGWTYQSGSLNAIPVAAPIALGGGTTVVIGNWISVDYTIENLGTVQFPEVEVGIYLSTDKIITSGDLLIDSFMQPLSLVDAAVGVWGLTSWDTIEGRQVRVPCGTPPGDYYVGVVIDLGHDIQESKEGNNSIALPFPRAATKLHVVSGSPGNDPCAGSGGTVPPGAPVDLTASDTSCKYCRLSWGNGTGGGVPTGHKIWRITGVDTLFVANIGAVTEFFDYPGPGTNKYRVVSFNEYGTGPPSVIVTGTVLASNLPDPSNLTASRDRCDGVQIGWSFAGVDPDSFVIKRWDGTVWESFTRPGSERAWLHSSAPAYSDAPYLIYAVDSCQTRVVGPAWGKVWPATFTGHVTSPTAVWTDSCSGVLVGWSFPVAWQPAIQGFRVYRDGALAFEGIDKGARSWVDTSPSGSPESRYSIEAHNPCHDERSQDVPVSGDVSCVTIGGGYMYLDTNGNGVHDPGDGVSETGSTVVDVWLSTDRNKDGSYATCSDGSYASNDITSYLFVLRAVGGTVSWSGFTNRIAAFGTNFGEYKDSQYYVNGRGGPVQPPGTYRLASITVTPQTGTPYIVIDQVASPASTKKTSFGSSCSGLDGDNTLRLGRDWFDKDGAGSLETWVEGGIRVYGGPGTVGQRSAPAIVSDGAGGAIIAWDDSRGGDPAHRNVYAQRILPTGDRYWGVEGVLVCSHPANQRLPQLVSDGAGGAIIAWEDFRGPFDEWDIYAQRISASGATLWPVNGVPICTAAKYQSFSASVGTRQNMVADGQGGAIITWEDSRTTYPNFGDLYAQKVNSLGSVQWALDGVTVCPIDPPAFDYAPAIVKDGYGGAVIVWMRGQVNTDIYAQRINTNGTTLWSDGLTVCNASGNQWSFQAAPDAGGGTIIVWADERSPGSASDIYAQRVLTGSGSILWGTNGVLVAGGTGAESEPAVTGDLVGGALLAYMSGASAMKTQKLDPLTGAKLWGPQGGALNPGTSPTIVGDGSGGAVVVTRLGAIQAQKVNESNGYSKWTSDVGSGLVGGVVGDGVGGVLVTWTGGDSTIYAMRVAPGGGTYITDVPAAPSVIGRTSLGPVYPNPFNPSTTIHFNLAFPSRARVRVYDSQGRLVRTLVNRELAAGPQATKWDGTNELGQRVASGVYYCRLEAAGSKVTRRMVLMK